jgi:hypothetical protein
MASDGWSEKDNKCESLAITQSNDKFYEKEMNEERWIEIGEVYSNCILKPPTKENEK